MTHDAATIVRAFEIADDCMFCWLESYGVPIGEHGTAFGLAAANGQEAQQLAGACDELRQAVEWLQPRGYVQLLRDTAGEYIAVTRRPGEA